MASTQDDEESLAIRNDDIPLLPIFDRQEIEELIKVICARLEWRASIEWKPRSALMVIIETPNGGPYGFRITSGKHGWFARITRVKTDAYAVAANVDHVVLSLFNIVLTAEIDSCIEGGIHHVTS